MQQWLSSEELQAVIHGNHMKFISVTPKSIYISLTWQTESKNSKTMNKKKVLLFQRSISHFDLRGLKWCVRKYLDSLKFNIQLLRDAMLFS